MISTPNIRGILYEVLELDRSVAVFKELKALMPYGYKWFVEVTGVVAVVCVGVATATWCYV